jgi:hypothetical protein
MRLCNIAILGLSTAMLAACASGPNSAELAAADYGRVIFPSECVEIAEKKIKPMMKDPYSAMFAHQECYKGFAKRVPVLGLPLHFGYIQNGTVNAKNSFGAYAGASIYQTVIKNGEVLRYCVASGRQGLCIMR